MNQNTSIDGAGESAETPAESLVRRVLQQQASALPPESPSIDVLRRGGRRRRRVRDAATTVGAVALVCGVAVGVHAVNGGSPASTPAAAGSPSASATATGPAESSPVQDDSAPPDWKPGPRLQVPTFTSVPSWMHKTSGPAELGSMATRNHDATPADPPYQGCISLGSSPLLWPAGFYAEGTPLTVFDANGRAVYVLDEGFTGVDGYPQIGWGNGQLDSGYSLTGCPSSLQAIGSYSLLVIFG